jgi:hypothetical protein
MENGGAATWHWVLGQCRMAFLTPLFRSPFLIVACCLIPFDTSVCFGRLLIFNHTSVCVGRSLSFNHIHVCFGRPLIFNHTSVCLGWPFVFNPATLAFFLESLCSCTLVERAQERQVCMQV